jgi:hypothetical protein
MTEQYPMFPSRRRRWPMVLVILVVVLAGLWSAAWYYGTAKAQDTLAGWIDREAKAGRVYACGSQSVSGFPFRVEVRCADPAAELKSNQPPLALKAKEILVLAQVWQPTVLTAEFTGPLSIGRPGANPDLRADWAHAEARLDGLPIDPERISVALEQPTFQRADNNTVLFKAAHADIAGRMLQGSAMDRPVIEAVLKLTAGSAPTLHPATVAPIDADVTAVLRGLKDFGPKPWPQRFRELQAAGGRIEITRARLRQADTVAVTSGALGLSPQGRLDGQLRVTVANLEKILPALGLDKMTAPQAPVDRVGSALDRLMPGLGNVARQNAGPALMAGLAFLGQPTELEGQRAFVLPLRFNDGMATLGPIPLGPTPPLF